jgi:hypothetical protein
MGADNTIAPQTFVMGGTGWVGYVAGNANACAANPMQAVQACIIDLTPNWIPAESPWREPTYQYPPPAQHTHYHYAANPAPLSDADVERIARRVAELLKAGA